MVRKEEDRADEKEFLICVIFLTESELRSMRAKARGRLCATCTGGRIKE